MKKYLSYYFLIIILVLIISALTIVVIKRKDEKSPNQILITTIATSTNQVEEDDYDVTIKYITEKGCSSDDKSNMEWKSCLVNLLKVVENEKQKHFLRLQTLFELNAENILVSNKEYRKELNDWYTVSNKNNYLRCTAEMYYTKAGSAYEGNISLCQIHETRRDIALLDDLYDGFIEVHDLKTK